MSKALVEKFFNEQFISLAQASLRKTIEEQKGQILVLPDLSAFEKRIAEVSRKRLTKLQSAKILIRGRRKAKELENRFKSRDPSRFRAIQTILETETRLANLPKTDSKGRQTLFILEAFSSADTVKNFIIDDIQSTLRLRKSTRKRLSSQVDRGHGVSGFAVSQAEISNAMYSINQEFGSNAIDFKSLVDSFVEEGKVSLSKEEQNALKSISTRYEQIIDPKTGKLTADYVSVIAYQVARENRGTDSSLEKRIKEIFFGPFAKHIEAKLLKIGHSSSLEEKVGNAIIEYLKPRIRVKNGKVVLRIDSKFVGTIMKSSGLVKTNVPTQSSKSKGTVSMRAKPRVRVRSGKPVLPDIRSFIGIINSRLPAQVAENMGTPRLNYRTGRFANSTTVTNIMLTQRGIPTIDYTYMRYPYEVFEYPGSGSPLAQQGQRDPRDLIDKSIREIMAEYALGRFYTRRV